MSFFRIRGRLLAVIRQSTTSRLSLLSLEKGLYWFFAGLVLSFASIAAPRPSDAQVLEADPLADPLGVYLATAEPSLRAPWPVNEAALEAPPPEEEDAGAGTQELDPEPVDAEQELPQPATIDLLHGMITNRLKESVAWLDAYLGSERYEAETEENHVRIDTALFAEEHEGLGASFKLRGKLNLPRISSRLRLLVGADSDDDADLRNTESDTLREEVTKSDTRSFGLGLQYVFEATEASSFSAGAGLRVRSGEPFGLSEVRYRYTRAVHPWLVSFTQRVQWLTSDGFVVPSEIALDRLINDDFIFHSALGGTWFEEERGYFYNADISLFQRLSEKRTLQYQWINEFRTEPSNRLEETTLRLQYRQQILREWLRINLAPQVSFPREHDFEPTPGILVGFEISFRW